MRAERPNKFFLLKPDKISLDKEMSKLVECNLRILKNQANLRVFTSLSEEGGESTSEKIVLERQT
jgi:hypothetical protein